ncbi:hypothetical protein [Streptomyces macrosporus]|uniref:hypothetical protein n=1 Tax=Streptomyces macrosporus TaxID=44032 RepID=UPI0031DA3E01
MRHAERAAEFGRRLDQRLVIGEDPVRSLRSGNGEKLFRVFGIDVMESLDIRLLPARFAPFDENYVDPLADCRESVFTKRLTAAADKQELLPVHAAHPIIRRE